MFDPMFDRLRLRLFKTMSTKLGRVEKKNIMPFLAKVVELLNAIDNCAIFHSYVQNKTITTVQYYVACIIYTP